MKKTLSINLNGMAFNIDDDAYEVLGAYLADIASHFEGDADKTDIMADIEARIAELLGERLQRQKEIISLADVQEVIGIMGTPSQFADDDAGEGESAPRGRRRKRARRFYRDPDTAVLGGVCGGIAARFGWDVSVVRLALTGVTLLCMVVGGGWFFVLAYFILWLIAPKAVTPSQRLEMQGEEVTVDNIKAEFDNLKNYVESDEFKTSTRSVGQRVGQVLRTVLKVVFGVVAGLVVAVIVFTLFFVVMAFLSAAGVVSAAAVAGMLPDFLEHEPMWRGLFLLCDGNVVWLVVAGLLVVGCPVFALVYALMRGVSGHRSKSNAAYWVTLLLWLAGIGILAGCLIPDRLWRAGSALFEERYEVSIQYQSMEKSHDEAAFRAMAIWGE